MINGLCHESWILLHCGSLVNEKNNLNGNPNSKRSITGGANGLRHEKQVIFYAPSIGGGKKEVIALKMRQRFWKGFQFKNRIALFNPCSVFSGEIRYRRWRI